jgi:hypothetical protein
VAPETADGRLEQEPCGNDGGESEEDFMGLFRKPNYVAS